MFTDGVFLYCNIIIVFGVNILMDLMGQLNDYLKYK
mgnify:FL=1